MELTGTVDLSRLTPPERLELISQLWDSLDADHVSLTALQHDELDRRLEMLEADREQGVPWEELRAELERRAP